MLEELIDLGTGLGVALMPLLLLAMPGIILFVVLPAILLLALAVPLAVIGAVLLRAPVPAGAHPQAAYQRATGTRSASAGCGASAGGSGSSTCGSRLICGSQASHFGRYQFQSPRSFIVAGSRTARTIVASADRPILPPDFSSQSGRAVRPARSMARARATREGTSIFWKMWLRWV